MAGAGLVVGVVLGGVVAVLVARHALGVLAEFFPVMSVTVVLAAFLAAQRMAASGYMAAFAAGVTVGNLAGPLIPTRAVYRLRLHQFADTTALILRMLIFVFLGAQINLAALWEHAGGLLLVVAVLMLVARPACVLVGVLPVPKAGWTRREVAFLSWVRETGVMPAALAGMLGGRHVPYADTVDAVVFVAVLATFLLQAGSTPWVAARLGLLRTRG